MREGGVSGVSFLTLLLGDKIHLRNSNNDKLLGDKRNLKVKINVRC